jgi:hypothetical protein
VTGHIGYQPQALREMEYFVFLPQKRVEFEVIYVHLYGQLT